MVAPAPEQLRSSKAHKGRRSKSQSAGGASIHKNVAYLRSAAPRNPNQRRTGAISEIRPQSSRRDFSLNPAVHLAFNLHFHVRETETCRFMVCACLLNEVSSLI